MAESEVTLRLASRGGAGVRKELADTANEVKGIGAAADAAGRQSEAGLGRTRAASESARSGVSSAADTMKSAGSAATLFVSVPLTAFLFKSAQAATQLNDVVDTTRTTFGRSGDAMIRWGGNVLDSLGLGKQTALEAANVFGGLFREMGAGDADAAKLSQRFVTLAVNLAAAKNVPLPAALSAIQGGLVGQYDTLKRLDVVLDENTVKQYAMSHGLASSTGEMSSQGAIAARLGLILQKGAQFNDAYAKSSDDGAKGTRKAQEAARDASAELGQSLIPIIRASAGGVRILSETFEHLPGPVQSGVAALLGLAIAAGPVLSMIGRLRALRPATREAAAGVEGIGTAAGGAATSSKRLGTALAGIGVTAGMVGVGLFFQRLAFNAAQAERHASRIATGAGTDPNQQISALEADIERQRKTLGKGINIPIGFGSKGAEHPDAGTGFRFFSSNEARKAADAIKKDEALIADLRAQLKGQAADTRNAGGATDDYDSIIKGLNLDLADTPTRLEQAAKAAETWRKGLGSMTVALDAAAASRNLASEQAKLADLLDQSDEQAERARAVTAARDDQSRANERLTEAEEALRKAKAGVSDIEREQLTLARDQAAERQKTAKRDAGEAQKHLDRLRAAGRSPKALQDAEDQLQQARLGSRQADEDARKSQQDLDDARVGSPAYAKRVAEAERDVRDARNQAAEAGDKLKAAQDELTPSAAKLAERQREIADQLDRVIRASETDWAAKYAAGMATASTATKGFHDDLDALGKLVAGNPLLAAIVTSAVDATTSRPEVEHHSGHEKQRARGGIGAGIATKETVLFGERSTGGEAFIPRRGISRDRALSILQHAAGWYGADVVAMAGGGVLGARPWGAALVRGGDGGSMGGVQIVRVVERHETHAGDEVHFHGSDPELVREYENVQRRKQISRSFSDASSNDWTR